MPLIFKKGDLFAEKFDIIINTCNTKGAMGRGIALEFKKRYPSMFEHYKTSCLQGELKPGNIYLYYDYDNSQAIINFTTKDHWKNPSKIEWIESGLRHLLEYMANITPRNGNKHMPSIGIPGLGCSNGGLSWDLVKPLIEKYLGDLAWDITVFEPLN